MPINITILDVKIGGLYCCWAIKHAVQPRCPTQSWLTPQPFAYRSSSTTGLHFRHLITSSVNLNLLSATPKIHPP